MHLDPQVGQEQAGRRPVLVISHKLLSEKTNLAVIVPITSKANKYSYQLILKGTKTQGAFLPLHVKSLDYRGRKIKFIERAPKKQVDMVVEGVKNLID
jgi:mRNA interferase MazF